MERGAWWNIQFMGLQSLVTIWQLNNKCEPYSHLCLRTQETLHLDLAITVTISNPQNAISEPLTQPANDLNYLDDTEVDLLKDCSAQVV